MIGAGNAFARGHRFEMVSRMVGDAALGHKQ